jgi:hypothetical protein
MLVYCYLVLQERCIFHLVNLTSFLAASLKALLLQHLPWSSDDTADLPVTRS